MTITSRLADMAMPFLRYLEDWFIGLESLPLHELVADQPEQVACISVDVINGFCKEGALASNRSTGSRSR
jgi:hypothetical protein